MIKLTFCLVRLPHLTREQFQDYWFNTHGPLVSLRRYVQLHSSDPALSAGIRDSRGGPEQYDGVAQLWWDSWESLTSAESDATREMSQIILEDERRFIDHPKSPQWWGEEKVIIG